MKTKTLETSDDDDLESKIEFFTIGSHSCSLIKKYEVYKKPVHMCSGIARRDIAKFYCLLDQNAFTDSQIVPEFMKVGFSILGGLPILMTLPKSVADPCLVKECEEVAEANYINDIPIGFMDLYHLGNETFSVSRFGIAKQYQGKGLSKRLLYAGMKIAGVKELYILTHLSNKAAHHVWLHLSPLEINSVNILDNNPDAILYKTKIPDKLEQIFLKHNRKTKELVPFEQVKSHFYHSTHINVVGYKQGIDGGLYVK